MAVENLEMVWGNTYVFDVAITRDDVVLDITGMTLRFAAKRNRSDLDAAAVITKTSAAGITVVSAPLGQVRVTILPADTALLSAASTTALAWDMALLDGTAVYTVAEGLLIVRPVVSRGA